MRKIITTKHLNYKPMAKKELNHEDKKAVFGALLPNKVIDLIGRKKCKEIAENAVNKEYKKLIKNK